MTPVQLRHRVTAGSVSRDLTRDGDSRPSDNSVAGALIRGNEKNRATGLCEYDPDLFSLPANGVRRWEYPSKNIFLGGRGGGGEKAENERR